MARWRRSRSTSSPTSPTRVPSMSTRPDGVLSAMRPPSASNRSTSPFSAVSTSTADGSPRVTSFATFACRASWRNSP